MAGRAMTQPQKIPHAELISPQKKLKEKVGSGGLDKSIIARAQTQLESNTIDFKPAGLHLVRVIDEALRDIQSGKLHGKPAIKSLLYPAMELKAQGAMFHYSLVTDISDTLINFLETVTEINADVIDLVIGYKMASLAILSKGLTGNGGTAGQELRAALADAYNRFYKNTQLK
jgi:hypothetical protein